MFVFGSGVLIGTQLNVPNPTPINFGLVQKVSVDTSVSVKELYGQYAFPVAVGSGTRKVTCKASLARFQRQALGRLLLQPDSDSWVRRSRRSPRSHSVPGTGPFTITVSNDALRGRPGRYLRIKRTSACRVASSPATGQYTVNTYDRRLHVRHRRPGRDRPDHLFLHRDTSPCRRTLRTSRSATRWSGRRRPSSATLFATDPTTNAQFSVTLNQCVASKFSFDTNIEDFAKPDFEFQAFANAAGQVMTFNFGDAGVSEEAFRHFAWRKDLVGSASALPRNQGDSTGAVRRLSRSRRLVDVGRIRRASQRSPARSPC